MRFHKVQIAEGSSLHFGRDTSERDRQRWADREIEPAEEVENGRRERRERRERMRSNRRTKRDTGSTSSTDSQ